MDKRVLYYIASFNKIVANLEIFLILNVFSVSCKINQSIVKIHISYQCEMCFQREEKNTQTGIGRGAISRSFRYTSALHWIIVKYYLSATVIVSERGYIFCRNVLKRSGCSAISYIFLCVSTIIIINNNNNNNNNNYNGNFIILKQYYIYNYTPLYLKVTIMVHN